jgi:hypothetical protein
MDAMFIYSGAMYEINEIHLHVVLKLRLWRLAFLSCGHWQILINASEFVDLGSQRASLCILLTEMSACSHITTGGHLLRSSFLHFSCQCL